MLIARLALLGIIPVTLIAFHARILVHIAIYARISIHVQTVIYNTQDLFARSVRLAIISIARFHLSALHAQSSVIDANNALMESVVMYV
jgi:hypothetical protein